MNFDPNIVSGIKNNTQHNLSYQCCVLQLLFQCTLVSKFIYVNNLSDPIINKYKEFYSNYLNNNATVDDIFITNLNDAINLIVLGLHDPHNAHKYININGKNINNNTVINYFFNIYCKYNSQNSQNSQNSKEDTPLISTNMININMDVPASNGDTLLQFINKSTATIIDSSKYLIFELTLGHKKKEWTIVPDYTININNKQYELRGFIYRDYTIKIQEDSKYTSSEYQNLQHKHIYYGRKNESWYLYDYNEVIPITDMDEIIRKRNASDIFLYVCMPPISK